MGSDLLIAILAAGASRRLGSPKQLVKISGETLLRRQCRIALEANLGPVVAICGSSAELCIAELSDLRVSCRTNDQWEEGMASSLRAAVAAAREVHAAALLVLLVDQYLLTAADLQSLVRTWRDAGSLAACRARHHDYAGPPAILSAALFDTLANLHGDQGARSVLAALNPGEVAEQHLPNAAPDVDLPTHVADLERQTSDG